MSNARNALLEIMAMPRIMSDKPVYDRLLVILNALNGTFGAVSGGGSSSHRGAGGGGTTALTGQIHSVSFDDIITPEEVKRIADGGRNA